jgi:hypothetical protein
MGVLTDFFRASESDLRATYREWKVPLDAHIRRQGLNPFTKEPVLMTSWDPNPEEIVEDRGAAGPPSPSIDMRGLGHTEVASLIAIVHDASKEVEERFYRPALIGPEDGPWINELPMAFVAKLATLDDAVMTRVAEAWSGVQRADIEGIPNAHTREHMLAARTTPYWSEVLRELVTFARATVAEGKHMYMWVCL